MGNTTGGHCMQFAKKLGFVWLYGYISYMCHVHPARLYYGVIVLWWIVCTAFNISVAHAGGNELLYTHVLAYKNMVTQGVQLQGLSLYYKHEANQYLSTLEWLAVKRQENTYWNNCWLVPIKKNDNILGGADCILINESTNHVCTIQFKTMSEYNIITLRELSTTYKGLSDVLFITVPSQQLCSQISEYFVTFKTQMNVVVLVHDENVNYEIWQQLVREHAKWLNLNQRVVIELYNIDPHKAHDMLEELGEEQCSFVNIVLEALAQTQWVIKGNEL